jgi:preprotein translocase subunit Sec63
MRMSDDPFTTLGVDENAGDEEIRRRYLELVRAWPPDREPEKFQVLRQAYEAVSGARQRLEWKLLHTSTSALSRLKLRCLAGTDARQRRPTEASMTALLLDSVQHADL